MTVTVTPPWYTVDMSRQTQAAAAVMPHPRHTANRIAKALRIVEFFDVHPLFTGVDASVVAEFDADTWSLITEVMGERRVPSDATVATVIGILIGRELS